METTLKGRTPPSSGLGSSFAAPRVCTCGPRCPSAAELLSPCLPPLGPRRHSLARVNACPSARVSPPLPRTPSGSGRVVKHNYPLLWAGLSCFCHFFKHVGSLECVQAISELSLIVGRPELLLPFFQACWQPGVRTGNRNAKSEQNCCESRALPTELCPLDYGMPWRQEESNPRPREGSDWTGRVDVRESVCRKMSSLLFLTPLPAT